MAEIKVGQKYVLLHGGYEGHIVEVTHVSDHWVLYKPGLEEPTGEWSTDSFLDSWLLLEEEDSEENNQLSPNAYQFPNRVEVRHISAHLTSFGGQAVQYIARATRLDGVVKGLPVQDLKKAIQLLEWEVDRLEAGK